MTSGATWAKQLKLKDMLKGAMKEKKKRKIIFFLAIRTRERKKRRGSELSKILSTIFGDRLVGIHRAKNESSSTQ